MCADVENDYDVEEKTKAEEPGTSLEHSLGTT